MLKHNVPIFDLAFDAILAAMYAVSDSAEGDCYLCVPPDPGIGAAALGASASAAPGTSDSATPSTSESAAPGAGESALFGTAPSEALHTFTLDSGASRSFFRDSTTLTPLSRPVTVFLADPSGGPVLAHSSTVLPCPAAPSSSPASAPCSCRPLSHETLLWHHCLGHPSLPSLRGMASRTLVSGLPESLPPLPPEPAPTCVPCVEGRQRAAPHSSEFPPTEAPLQTLHMHVWGPAHVSGQGHERYFLLVVDDYSRYTTVFPLRRKGEVIEAEVVSSGSALRAFCRAEGIRQTFTLPASPQQNGIAERRIGMPRVSLPETTPTLRWTGKVGNASVFRVCGSRAFVRDTSTNKLSSRVVPCVFLGFPPDAPGWQFYHHTCPLRTSRALPVDPLPPQGPAPSGVSQVDSVDLVKVAVDSGAARGAEPAGAGPGGAVPGVAESEGAEPGGAEPERVEPGGVEPGGVEPERAESGGPPGVPLRREPLSAQRLCERYARRCSRAAGATGPAAGGAYGAGAVGGATSAGAAGAATPGGTGVVGGPVGVGAAGGAEAAGPGGARTGGIGAAGAGGPAGEGAVGAGATGSTAGCPTGVGAAGGAGAAGPGGARTGGTGAAGAGGATGVGAVGAGAVSTGGATGGGAAGDTGACGAVGVVAGDPRAEGTGAVSAVSGGVARPRPYYIPLLQQVLGLPPSLGPPCPLLSPPPVQFQSQLQPASPLLGPSPCSGPTNGLTERREPESRPASPESRPASPESRPELPVCARVPLPSPPASSLADYPDPESDSLHAASPSVMRFLAIAVTDPSFETTAASALVAELVEFAASCRLDYASSLVAESESASVCPPSVGDECALGTDVLEDRQEEFECFAATLPHLVSVLLAPKGDPDALDIPTPRSFAEAIEGPYSSQWQAPMDTEMASWKSTGTYVDQVPPPRANIVNGMWIFRVKRPPGSPPIFKACYVARGFSQRHGVDFFQTFSPTPKMTTLRVLLHIAARRDYELHFLDFSTAFLQGSLLKEIWLRRPPGLTRSFPAGTQWSLRRPVYGLRQAPREWHDTLRTTLAALEFAPSTSYPSLFLRTDTTLPPFYVLVYVVDLVFATADTEALAHVKSELQKRHTCTDLGPSVLRLHVLLALVHSSAYRSLALSSPFGRVCRAEWPVSRACGLPHVPDHVDTTCTRPDLAYPLSILARYVAPGRHRKEHMDAAKRVLRYLCSTSGMGLVLGGQARVVFTGHADASWVDDLATQRSSQGYTFSLGSGSVSWRSTRSSSVLSSSCEAEIYAGAMATLELRWFTYLLTNLGEAPRSPPVLYGDNKAMLALC
ncbi:unnamed protein product [Closterium sp. NIES-53]